MLTAARRVVLVAAAGALVAGTCAATAVADPSGGDPPGGGTSVTSDPRGGSVGIGVTEPGTGGTSGTPTSGKGGGGGTSTDPCVYTPANPPPGPDTPIGAEIAKYGGSAVYVICPGGSGGYEWVPKGKAKPAPPSAATLAQTAYGELRLSSPVPANYPSGKLQDGRPYVVVRANTWFWAGTPWTPLSKRVCAGGVCATATAKPTQLTFDPGARNSSPVSCAGPGTAWPSSTSAQQQYLVPGSAWVPKPSPGGCSYPYQHSTYGYPNGELTATYTITWTVSWTGTDGTSGTLAPLQTDATSTYAVAEVQSVVTH